jgi:Transposase IS116/IS110/IS902 family
MPRPGRLDCMSATKAATRTLAPPPGTRRRGQGTRGSAQATHHPRCTATAARAGNRTRDRRRAAAPRRRQPNLHPKRLRLAALCGASPVQASSGKTTRHCLNRGSDRQASSVLWLIANNCMNHHARTRGYVARRTKKAKTNSEIRHASRDTSLAASTSSSSPISMTHSNRYSHRWHAQCQIRFRPGGL